MRSTTSTSRSNAQGDYVSIMGPSGSGKVDAAERPGPAGLADLRATTGSTTSSTATMGDDELAAATRQKKIGFVFQSFHLVPRMNAFENVELPMVLAGCRRHTSAATRRGARSTRVGLAESASDHRPGPVVRRRTPARRDRPRDRHGADDPAGRRTDRQPRQQVGQGNRRHHGRAEPPGPDADRRHPRPERSASRAGRQIGMEDGRIDRQHTKVPAPS